MLVPGNGSVSTCTHAHIPTPPRLSCSEIERIEGWLCWVITDPPAATLPPGGLAGYLGNMYIAFFGFYCTVSTINLLF